ncbi:hypothetical protein EH223_14370 [candidate division KSB1 bacterium]|nr:MotA/TolQ/ExbB proton channel family protein [candidate division KSB1 bacterium]RQW01667.1 MAG: hypothetical protein EH223_14370 [candidate division KSB1 bacterium]
MLTYFQAGGAFMWLLLVILIIIIVLAVARGIQLFSSKEKSRVKLEHGINAILFWGAYSVVVGFFAHFLGVMYAMEAIKRANDISPAIVAGGYSVSLLTILFGLIIFMIAAIIWFVYRTILLRRDS